MDKKKGLAIILAGGKPKDKDEEQEESNEELKVLAEDILKAISDKDAEALSDALEAFVVSCE